MAAIERLRLWFRPPRNLLVLFLAIVVLPAVALTALGLRLLEQDRVLARQRNAELLESACDRAVRVLQFDVNAITRALHGRPQPSSIPADAVVVFWSDDYVESVPPGRIAYSPAPRALIEPPGAVFDQLEAEEFRSQNLTRALTMSQRLAMSADPSIRAGALLREARILRKLQRADDALRAYAALRQIESVAIAGTPADLLARRAACALLAERSRTEELRREATALETDLRSGKWELDRASYLRVSDQLRQWLGGDGHAALGPERLAEAVEWVHRKRHEAGGLPSYGSQLLSIRGAPVSVLWVSAPGRDGAWIAGPDYLRSRWMRMAQIAAAPAELTFLLRDAAPRRAAAPAVDTTARRMAAETGLPWTITAAATSDVLDQSTTRRRTLLAGLMALLVFIAAASYFTWRSVTRELAVARLQSDFVSAVSHEFKTPLTTLRQFNELLDDGSNTDPPLEKRRSYYLAQSRATERLHRLVASLLDFGRMEAGKHPYRFERLDLAQLTEEIVREFRHEMDGRGFSIGCSFGEGAWIVDADAEAVSTAVWNLLDNAVKYSGESRTILVTLSRSNEGVALAVRDQGIGIPAAERTRIFQKFVRGEEAQRQRIQGTGIGLTLVKHIVDAHGGRVHLQSEPGAGSTFTIVLPAEDQ